MGRQKVEEAAQSHSYRIKPSLKQELDDFVAVNGGNRNGTVICAIETYLKLQNEKPQAA
jgi:hypothetical protein